MSVITSFVNVIAGASVLLGGKAFMDEKITADGPSIRKVVGVPLLGVGALGILVSYVRNKRVREDKKAESDFYEAELYEADNEPQEVILDEECGLCGDTLILVDDGFGQKYKNCLGESCGYVLPMNAELYEAENKNWWDMVDSEHCDACEEVRNIEDFSQSVNILNKDPKELHTGMICDYCFGDFYEAELYDADYDLTDRSHMKYLQDKENVAGLDDMERHELTQMENEEEYVFLFDIVNKETGELIEDGEITVYGTDREDAKAKALQALEEGKLDDEEITLEAENDPDFDPVKADRNKDGKISSWERNVGNAIAKSMRENKGAEDFGYDDDLEYHVYVSDKEDSVGYMDDASHFERLEDAVKAAIKVAKTHGKGKWVMVIEENRDDDYEDVVYEIDNMGNVTLTPDTSEMQEHITFDAESKFDRLEDKIAAQYRKKGMSKEEADRIGAATAAKIGFKKYGKKGMVAKAKKGRRAETFDAEGGITFADVPRETLGGTNNNPVRIIVGGPPHSGKSTLMNLIEDKMKQYGVSVELRDLDFSAPTDLKGGFNQNREKKDWTPELAEEAATYFDEDSDNRVILGDSIGLISRINEIVSEPADVAILLVSGSQGDDDRTYRDAIKKWMQYYDDIDKPVLMVIRSSMNPEDMNYFDPHDNYGVIVGLDRNAYNQGGDSNEISLENACLEGIVFEIAQEFDLGLANRSTRRHIDIVEESWPSIRGKPTWNPIDAGKPHLARIEEEYFEELKRRKMGE